MEFIKITVKTLICFGETAKPRVYFIPYDTEEKAEKGFRGDSNFFKSPNGMWKFRHFEHVKDERRFLHAIPRRRLDDIIVPSNWQMKAMERRTIQM